MDDPRAFDDKDPKERQQPLRSPVRPAPPESPAPPEKAANPEKPPSSPPAAASSSPVNALGTLRQKMEAIADEFAAGKINRAQFYALYRRYSEQRAIIERLVERNPQTDAWKQVIGAPGQTGFLRMHFAAQALYFVVFRNNDRHPLLSDGREHPDLSLLDSVLLPIWRMASRPKQGLGRKQIGEQKWLILAIGEYGSTVVVWSTEPSLSQSRLVRDLHADFERANQAALARGLITPDKLVFPQRALMDRGG
ncbi:MAG: hypothetical protein L6Q98_09940 [Anaerolineae bacterium]|nr:hypothetical protein [Anaerolineae bacterium]NUQ03120.1 hypothetical protein [Anaerolineae bacterium]